MNKCASSGFRVGLAAVAIVMALGAGSGASAAILWPRAAHGAAPYLLVMAQDVRITGRRPQPQPPDSYRQPGSPGYPFPPSPYGYYGQQPQQQAAPAPCPDVGSTAVVERARPPGTRRGPLVAMPTNDCADLPGSNAVQPFIGVDVQITPPGMEPPPIDRPTPRRPGG
jgi:hypothetical protein